MNKNKKSVLMIGSDISVKGGMTSVVNLYKQYDLFEDTAYYLASHKPGSAFSKATFFIIFFIKYMLFLLFKPSIKIIHFHTSYKGSFFRKCIIINIAKLFGKKTIYHLHGSEFNVFFDNSTKSIQKLITNTLNKTDVILVLSNQWKKDIEAKCSNPNIKVFYNPAVLKDKEKEATSEKNNINVLFMGLIGERKGAFDLIKAAKSIQNNNVKINIYGNGEENKAQQMIDQDNLNDKIVLGGWISGNDVANAYKNADIFVLPSYNEGLPMSILEAMSYSLPIISTPVGGIPDAVIENNNGYLIPPGDSELLAKRINGLADDQSLRNNMGQQSYKIASEKFDIIIIMKQLKNLYEELKK
ncbi:MAG: glycosyltransferase family 4 protein [Vampirovibrionia bacterium]